MAENTFYKLDVNGRLETQEVQIGPFLFECMMKYYISKHVPKMQNGYAQKGAPKYTLLNAEVAFVGIRDESQERGIRRGGRRG